MKEKLVPYGPLKAFNLVMDKQTGNSKVWLFLLACSLAHLLTQCTRDAHSKDVQQGCSVPKILESLRAYFSSQEFIQAASCVHAAAIQITSSAQILPYSTLKSAPKPHGCMAVAGVRLL